MNKPTDKGEWVILTEIEKKCFSALSEVTFLPASFDKRFARSVIGAVKLTEKQRNYAVFIFNKYRRQIRKYQELAFELQPERFDVKINFSGTLFTDQQADIKFNDTFKPKRFPSPPNK